MNIKDIKQMAPSELTKTLREQKEEPVSYTHLRAHET